ncbi:hypothetical protein SAMN05216553_101379 [Lentzea fradiae]|uniref:Uncharacterized protein n=1 Tax=Lentzea fradiae TaxID=200378 RepID=A0A1G7KNN2_9PSEU|nr:hypothetical protein SAMN05216553_101379 [Lentzea fradiae]
MEVPIGSRNDHGGKPGHAQPCLRRVHPRSGDAKEPSSLARLLCGKAPIAIAAKRR